MPPAKKRAKSRMTDEHKEALALGREQGRVVRGYLEALELHRPKRGRKRTQDSIKKQLAEIEEKLQNADPLSRVLMIQQRIDLQRELDTKDEAVDITSLEDAFVGAARDYGLRKGITYAAWREAGVPPQVLRRAGITRSA